VGIGRSRIVAAAVAAAAAGIVPDRTVGAIVDTAVGWDRTVGATAGTAVGIVPDRTYLSFTSNTHMNLLTSLGRCKIVSKSM
jgi:hypothetical protein